MSEGQSPPWPEAPMTEPWQGEIFALAVHLSQRGLFSWSEWTARFSAALADERATGGPLAGGGEYWRIWQTVLERLVAERAALAPESVGETAEAWRRAYLSTPHGAPVRLGPEKG